jgi:antitoxin ParD1/3/4
MRKCFQEGECLMRNTQPLSITLPHDMIEMVKAKVSSGEYATESEVIRDGLRILQARDAALEKWLHEEVVKSYDECKADESLGIPAEDIVARVRSNYRKRTTQANG